MSELYIGIQDASVMMPSSVHTAVHCESPCMADNGKPAAACNRLSSLEELSGMEVLASDKTGTLTLNKCAYFISGFRV